MNHSRTTILHAIAAALALLSTTALAATQTVDGIRWTYTVSGNTASVGSDDDISELFLLITTLIMRSNEERYLAEKLLDEYFPEK